MLRLASRTLKLAWKLLLASLLGGAIVAAVLISFYVNSLPELKVWHDVHLDGEFDRTSPITSFEEYLALEDRLFQELDRRIVERVPPGDRTPVNRYSRGSDSDPARWPHDWNRSFELTVPEPRAGALLLHGMSDSPYSLRHVGSLLHERGAWVVGLRVPGHGTAPSGLTTVTWEDMAAAVRIAVRHLRDRIGDRPLYLVGYSNGAALSVQYALAALDDPALPRVQGLVLFSPMIGVTPAAAFAIWQERLGRALGIDELKYTSITPEYDPFKYGSFAVNAGNQTYRLTKEIRQRIAAADMSAFPPVLALQSAVDSTVSTPDLVSVLMQHLPENGSELVLFDINRQTHIEYLLRSDPAGPLRALLASGRQPFVLTVLTNRDEGSADVVLRQRRPHQREATPRETGMSWPGDVFSLGHIALPFPASDPLYGDGRTPSPGIALGNVALRGEKGALRVTAADMLRIRWNPFFPWVQQRILDFVQRRPD
jgi:alpha-beta hydrolase superfamily lysophospholipase